MTPPLVSVVTPTRYCAGYLEVCLRSLVQQDFPADAYEILVVDDGSTDATGAVLAAAAAAPGPAVRTWRFPHRGANAARNTGVQEAKGSLICFVDDDQQAPPGWLAAMTAGAERFSDAACFGGPMRLLLEAPPPRSCGCGLLGESELDLGGEPIEVDYVWGGNMAMPRWAFDRIGPFDESMRLLGGQEAEWQDRAHAAGLAVRYLPDAWLWHRRTAQDLRLARLVRRRFARGRGQAINFAAAEPYRAGQLALAAYRASRHGAYRRCSVGVLNTAHALGRLAGVAEVAIRNQGSR